MQIDESAKECYLKAVELLARRPYSEFKLHKKLREKQFDEPIIQDVFTQLKKAKYLDDTEYAWGRMKALVRSGYSPDIFAQILEKEQLFVAPEQIDNFLSEQHHTTEQITEDYFNSRYKNQLGRCFNEADIKKWKGRCCRGMLQKGHSLELTFKLIDKNLRLS